MDERWRNYKGGSEHRWRCDLERGEFARRIEIQRVAALGIQLANARRAGKANARRSFSKPFRQKASPSFLISSAMMTQELPQCLIPAQTVMFTSRRRAKRPWQSRIFLRRIFTPIS